MLKFIYDFGSYNKGYWNYKIEGENGIYKLIAHGSNGVKLNLSLTLENSDIESLIAMINETNLIEWNGFDQTNSSILDGYDFKLEYSYENESIYAHGYMMYPKNYEDAHAEITNFIDNLIKKYN